MSSPVSILQDSSLKTRGHSSTYAIVTLLDDVIISHPLAEGGRR
jgi:hypothetical protein